MSVNYLSTLYLIHCKCISWRDKLVSYVYGIQGSHLHSMYKFAETETCSRVFLFFFFFLSYIRLAYPIIKGLILRKNFFPKTSHKLEYLQNFLLTGYVVVLFFFSSTCSKYIIYRLLEPSLCDQHRSNLTYSYVCIYIYVSQMLTS